MANHIKWKGEFPQLPATVVKANDMSISERKDVIKLYNDAITNLDTKVLPEVHFSLKTDKSRWVGLSKHRESSKVYSKRIKRSGDRPIFTEGLSSQSKTNDPAFFVKPNSVVSSNLPNGVHYSRDKSKIVFETKSKSKNRADKNAKFVSQSVPGSSLSWSEPTPRAISVATNNELLLPKVHIEKQISIIDYVRAGNLKVQTTPRYGQTPLHTQGEGETGIDANKVVQPANTPRNSTGSPGKLGDDITSTVIKREHSTVSNTSRKHLASRGGTGPKSDIPKVSLGNDLDLSFLKGLHGRQSAQLERQKSFDSRATLSTPGRSLRDRNVLGNAENVPHDSKSIVSCPPAKHGPNKTVAWENAKLHSDSVEEREFNDILGPSFDPRKLKVVRKLTIGDPVRESKQQDKRLDKSKLTDLYNRGVVREHLSNYRPANNRVTIQMLRRDDRNGKFGGSRASGLSTLPGGPPPSVATFVAPVTDQNGAGGGGGVGGKPHHPLLSPERSYMTQGLVVEGSTVMSIPDAPSPEKGRLVIDGALINKIEAEKED